MNKLILIAIAFFMASCGKTDVSSERAGNTDAFVHFERLSDRGERKLGDESYIYILPVNFRSDTNVAKTVIANIQHSADVCNYHRDTNIIEFPYVLYEPFQARQTRDNTWVMISDRLIPDTSFARIWMDSIAKCFPPQVPDPSPGSHLLTDHKIKWRSPDLIK